MSHARNVIQGVIDDLKAFGTSDIWQASAAQALCHAAQKLAEVIDCVPNEPFDKRCADALADEVDLLVRKKVIDSRSPAADALLCYRDPPTSPRSDRLLDLEAHLVELRAPTVKVGPFPDEQKSWDERLEELRKQFREITDRLAGMKV